MPAPIFETKQLPEFAHEDLIAGRIHTRTHQHFHHFPTAPEGLSVKKNPISLTGGQPNHGFFPVTSIDVNLASKPFAFDKAKVATVPAVTDKQDEIGLELGLQYAACDGFKTLRDFTKSFVKRVVNPVAESWATILTVGGADGVSKCFDVLVNPGDTILFEEFTFVPILNLCREKGGTPIPIELTKVLSDTEYFGTMDYAEELEDMLENWETRYPGKKTPKAMYTVSNGHNPLGVAQTLDNKKKIYALAEKYNFMIIEDEPYAYLNFSSIKEKPNYELTNDEFVASLRPSYLQLDKSGRVVRIETFSKIFAPGARLGYAIGHPKFLSYIESTASVSTRAPSGFSQAIIADTIRELGGLEGWIHWITLVRNEYLRRKNALVTTLLESEAAKKGYISVLDPACGMFVALKINFKEENKIEPMEKYYFKCLEAGVIAVLGQSLAVDTKFSGSRCNFLRIAISAPDTADVLIEAGRRFSEAAVEYFEE